MCVFLGRTMKKNGPNLGGAIAPSPPVDPPLMTDVSVCLCVFTSGVCGRRVDVVAKRVSGCSRRGRGAGDWSRHHHHHRHHHSQTTQSVSSSTHSLLIHLMLVLQLYL